VTGSPTVAFDGNWPHSTIGPTTSIVTLDGMVVGSDISDLASERRRTRTEGPPGPATQAVRR
jgi:hypothetical protein